MATSYLNKIILEEIKKVIKEQWIEDRLNEPGVDQGTSKYTAKAPVMPKTKKVLELQKILKNMNMYDGPLDGMPGKLTKQAVGKLAGIKSKFISSKEILDDTDSYIAAALNYDNKNKDWAGEDPTANAVASAKKGQESLPTQFRSGENSAEASPSAKEKTSSRTEKLGQTRKTAGEYPNIELSDRVLPPKKLSGDEKAKKMVDDEMAKRSQKK